MRDGGHANQVQSKLAGSAGTQLTHRQADKCNNFYNKHLNAVYYSITVYYCD